MKQKMEHVSLKMSLFVLCGQFKCPKNQFLLPIITPDINEQTIINLSLNNVTECQISRSDLIKRSNRSVDHECFVFNILLI